MVSQTSIYAGSNWVVFTVSGNGSSDSFLWCPFSVAVLLLNFKWYRLSGTRFMLYSFVELLVYVFMKCVTHALKFNYRGCVLPSGPKLPNIHPFNKNPRFKKVCPHSDSNPLPWNGRGWFDNRTLWWPLVVVPLKHCWLIAGSQGYISTLNEMAFFLAHNFSDAGGSYIVNSDVKNNIIESLACFVCYPESLKSLEQMSLQMRKAMIKTLLSPYESR